MSISASSELVSLCRSQLGLLQSWGAVYSTIYLTEKLPNGSKTELVPLLVYPDLPDAAIDSSLGILPVGGDDRTSEAFEINSVDPDYFEPLDPMEKTALVPQNLLKLPYELFLPLIHEQLAIGLLVTVRQDRSWNQVERQQIEKIAQTLAIACVMERQQGWLKQQLLQQQRLRSQQRDLLNNLLHQIRSPLTAIRTFGKLLLKRFLPERDREIVTGIVQQSDRLKELLEQIDASLDLNEQQSLILEARTSIDASMPAKEPDGSSLLLLPGNISTEGELDTENCDLASIIEPLILSAQAIAQEKQQQVLANIPPNLPSIEANPAALREVLSNIIDNALKYTPVGGKIWIEAGNRLLESTGGHWLNITISDSGCGINPTDLERIFERSYRGVQANSDIPGTGLGLAIAKELIEKMNGKIQVFSPPQSGNETKTGTSFEVWLPISKD